MEIYLIIYFVTKLHDDRLENVAGIPKSLFSVGMGCRMFHIPGIIFLFGIEKDGLIGEMDTLCSTHNGHGFGAPRSMETKWRQISSCRL